MGLPRRGCPWRKRRWLPVCVVEFSGLAPGYVGLWQIDARVPDAASIPGLVPVVIVAPWGFASNAVTIWVE